MFMHDIYHTGRTNLNGPETPKEKFRFSTGELIDAFPVNGNEGTIYITSEESKLYAINSNGTKVTILFKGSTIELWIDNPQARVNGELKWIDENNHNVKPIIINNRTMLHIRFDVENLGCEVLWDGITKK